MEMRSAIRYCPVALVQGYAGADGLPYTRDDVFAFPHANGELIQVKLEAFCGFLFTSQTWSERVPAG